MVFDISKFIGKFSEEAGEHISKINHSLLEYEKDTSNFDLLNQVFRSAHTIKGSSKILQLSYISEVAHKFEDVLEALRNKKIPPSKELFSIFFRSVDLMSEMVEKTVTGQKNITDENGICLELDRALDQKTMRVSEEKNETLSANPKKPEKKLQPTAKKPKSKKSVEPETTSTVVDNKPLKKTVETRTPEESIKVQAQKLDDSIKVMGEILSNHGRMKQGLIDLDEILKISKNYLEFSTNPEIASLQIQNTNSTPEAEIAKTLYSKIKKHASNMRDVMNIHGLLTEGLREKVLQLRMMPLSSAVETFPRLVRDLSASSGKEVDFILEGVDTEMDKRVIEKIGDPLLHMIRNSVDHGIERPEERKRKGKPRKGTLKVSARYEGESVHIEISDDGGGIPIEKIKKKAIQRNLRSNEDLSKMPDAEIANLIFEPGFSTSPIITDISGRGVGMDVVKENIVEQLKGSIQTETHPDKGTCFTIRVPLTLAVMRILLFSVSQTLFGFPISSVREIIRVQKSEIIEVVNKQAIRLRDQIIPVTELKKIINLPETNEREPEDSIILLLAMGNEMIGVMIDHLISEEDMEIKPLPSHMRNSDLASGATITGKGDVVILLHVPKIMAKSKIVQESKQTSHSPKKKKQHILIVEDSVSTREIEKSILESYGYQVDIASDGIEGLEKTQKFKYDLVLSDIEMPRLDGFALVEKLRNDAENKHVPIIIVSSRDREEDKRRGIEVGADAYIIKGSFDQSNLLATVQSLI
ncbi:MAG: hybrid sensor histidine kinase/response regulator [Nitrospina sp.]|nr:hybrid sensor histidine kinase/response regulator [Nitrospina sp.]